MRTTRFMTTAIMAAAILTFAATAHAQATRTWVSGVGDDANPCSRTAPCKTFAGAISKTAASGEITVLDPGGFGAVTITKSITIEGGGIQGAILSSLVTGVLINNTAVTSMLVTVRNININGAGNGTFGIRVLSNAGLSVGVAVDNVHITGVANTGPGNGVGIDFAPRGNSFLNVSNSIVRNSSQVGISVRVPAGASPGTRRAVISNTRLEGNPVGLNVDATGGGAGLINVAAAHDVVATGSITAGFLNAGGGTTILQNCMASSNNVGVRNDSGTVQIIDTTSTLNSANTSGTVTVSGSSFIGPP